MRRFDYLLVFIGVIASACRPGTPSESSGEADLRQRIDGGKADRLRLVSFQKTDGQLMEQSGMKAYKMDFTAEIEFVRDALYSTGVPFPNPGSAITTADLPAKGYFRTFEDLRRSIENGTRPACRGDQLTLKGFLEFSPKESGWKSSDASMTVSMDSANRKENCLTRNSSQPSASATSAPSVSAPTGVVNTVGASGAAVAPAPRALSAADLTGTWNIRAVPLTGDMTPSVYLMTANADNNGWTQTSRGLAAPVAIRVTIDGDSLMTEAGPFESVRRGGVQVRINSVFRLQDGSLVGTTVAHYATQGADSVLRFRATGTRAR